MDVDGPPHQMLYVHVLQSIGDPDRIYFGATADLKEQFTDHNSGESPHTSKFKPWQLACYIALPDRTAAYEFERYLKSHSGRAFLRKRLLASPTQVENQ